MKLSKARFKPQALEYFRQVQQTGEDIILTDHGRPAIRITRFRPQEGDPFRALRGSVTRYADPEDPVGEPWDAGA